MKYQPHFDNPNDGALRVWHIPQVPMEPFYVVVDSLRLAKDVMDILAAYDNFQYRHRVKPDYSSVQGVERYELNKDRDGKVTGDWWDVDEEELEALDAE